MWPGAGRRVWLAGAAAAVAAGMTGPLMAQGQPTPERRQRIAEALGSPAAVLKQVQRIALPAGLGGLEAWLAIVDRRGDPKPFVLVLGPMPAPAPLTLPTAAQVDLLAQLDLHGAPRKLDPAGPGTDAAGAWRGQPAAPAVLLRTRHRLDSGEQRDTLVLVALAAAPTLLWEAIARSERPQNEGHRSFALEFAADPSSAPWLGIALFQTTVPPIGQPPGQPGPPLRQRFTYRAGTYQRSGG